MAQEERVILKMGQMWGKWPLGAMRKNANIFFAMIVTEVIETLLEASCKKLLENIRTFHKILKIFDLVTMSLFVHDCEKVHNMYHMYIITS